MLLFLVIKSTFNKKKEKKKKTRNYINLQELDPYKRGLSLRKNLQPSTEQILVMKHNQFYKK